ncbi:TPA: hypothetical protein ACHTCR_004934 [Pseudomonas putida]|uniref:hypothetical protein n=1 Tax=Pseudomonas TaxID=286 RepID=UPI000F3AF289|nr:MULTISPECIES: hypothetical protein [Pseudomonas]MCB2255804.1 hypothetical protein [Pseudomonas chlororaphis]RNF73215.1 hypothetical protein EFJ98_07715 [Pseudomonas putida]
MDTNKMREQFEAAYLAESTRRNGRTYPSVLTRGDDGNYVIPSVQSAWWAWRASRDSVVVVIDVQDGEVSVPDIESCAQEQGIRVEVLS